MLTRKTFLRATAGFLGTMLSPTIPGCATKQNDKSEKFAERILSDTATAMLGFGAYVGDRLGIFKTMAAGGPATVSELAARTHLRERYMQEWLALMATGGYVGFDPETSTYQLPAEHVPVLCDENSPFFMGGFVELLACVLPVGKVLEGFRGGKGPLAEDYAPEHWEGIERSTVPSYRNFLTRDYLPAMPDIVARLNAGGAVLDLGCGGGIASLEIAKSYRRAEVFGVDVYAPSIEKAKKNALAAGLGDRIRFETYDGVTLPADRYDLVTIFYTVHHLTAPVKTLRSAGRALRKGGVLLIMEANVPEKVEQSIGHPYANWNYGVSLFYCMSEVLSEGGPGYGAAIKGSEIKALAEQAGFARFRRLPVENPYDALYELKL
jgi:ubiquinone/menaquinone biosynthesis C-methylase UbiE